MEYDIDIFGEKLKFTNFDKEIKFLFKTIDEEFKEYNLKFPEISMLFDLFLKLFYTYLAAEESNIYVNKILNGEFDFSENSIKGFYKEIKSVIPDISDYHYSYFFKYYGENNHLKNITKKYLSLYRYPNDNIFLDTEGLKKSIAKKEFYKDIYPDFIRDREKSDKYCSKGWYLRSRLGVEIHLDNAIFVWPEC